MSRTFVIADMHGAYKAFIQCLQRSGFDYEKDNLIQLGDIVDRWPESYECVEELLKIKNLISIKGNHDDWFESWLKFGQHGSGWKQGAFATLQSYGKNCLGEKWEDFQVKYNSIQDVVFTNLNFKDIPENHKEFFSKQINYYIDDEKRCFVHGGFNRHCPINQQNPPYIYYWDRDLWLSALSYKAMEKGLVMKDEEELKFKIKDDFNEIYIGHTSTTNWNTTEPMQAANIWNLDTGCGGKGKLTIMDINTKEYWQSDLVTTLYPNESF